MNAVVNAPICPLMTQPRHDCETADEALYGMVVEVLEQTTPDYWKVRTPYRYEGYAPVNCLAVGDRTAREWTALPKRVVLHKNFADVTAAPKVQSWHYITLPLGSLVAVTQPPETDPQSGAPTGWQRVTLVDGREGCVRSSWLDIYYDAPISLPEEALRRRLCDAAMRYARTPYRWGGKSPLGIDCSGLVSMAYLLNGIIIYRDAQIRPDFPAIVEIPRRDMAPGDLLFFPGHVAMYLGDGRYLHSTGRAGSDGVDINSLEPLDPRYREDLDKGMTAVGSYALFHR